MGVNKPVVGRTRTTGQLHRPAGEGRLRLSFRHPDYSYTFGILIEGRYDEVDYHKYELLPDDRTKARWTGFVRRGPPPQRPSTPETMREL